MTIDEKITHLEFLEEFFQEQNALACCTVEIELDEEEIEAGLTPDVETKCFYLTGDGLKCAVGCRIPAEMYDPDMEDASIGSLLVQNPDLADILSIDDFDKGMNQDEIDRLPDVNWWRTVQTAHDGAEDINDFLTHVRGRLAELRLVA